MKRRKNKLNGTPKASRKSGGLSMEKILDEIKNPALVFAGLFAGKFLGDYADGMLKVTRTNGVATVDGADAGIKGYIVPVAELALGVGSALMVDNQMIKMLGVGLAANGLYRGASMIAKKDILNGLGEAPMQYLLPEYPIPDYSNIPEGSLSEIPMNI